ncbi:MAG: hypothetical protein P4L81_07685 [Candidatus Pacebacteria bacterium]|nr:hypothetical protein [Candidatus Paceibacterota bacterium]
MTQIVAILLSFLLTALIGNRLLQQWQHRVWLRQQQFLGEEKEYLSLKELFPELSGAIGKRLYQTQRLYWAISALNTELVEDRLAKYDDSVVKWNDNLGSFYARLNIYADFRYSETLERSIHRPFQNVGAQLEAQVRKRRLGGTPTPAELAKLERQLLKLSATTSRFCRDLLKAVEEKRKLVYFGRRVAFSVFNLRYFSTWQLVKALFISDVDSHSIIRSATDLR